MELSEGDLALAAGTPAQQLAMRVLVRVGETMGAARLLDITSAHIDGCLYHGRAGLDFAERLVSGVAHVTVPTTLNVSSLDLLHPDLYRGDEATAKAARHLMECYVEMGCVPTWTCAPYQLPNRPAFGEHVAWAESNAIVFANSVLGARTNRYGDFIDICAAITGRAPAAGLHLDEHRAATVVVHLADIPHPVPRLLYPVLGHLVGGIAGTRVAAISGLAGTDPDEDDLKALGAGAASSGGVGLVHIVGITPEAPDLATVATASVEECTVTAADFRDAVADLTTVRSASLDAVAVGTPHASTAELERIAGLVSGRRLRVPLFVSTSRSSLARSAHRVVDCMEDAGVTIVTDTCTYVTPILQPEIRTVMTDSAKWAYYAPGNLGVDVAFGSLDDCVESATAGRIVRTGWPGD